MKLERKDAIAIIGDRVFRRHRSGGGFVVARPTQTMASISDGTQS